MAQFHNFSITELENMVPYERDIYCDLIKSHAKMLQQQAEQGLR